LGEFSEELNLSPEQSLSLKRSYSVALEIKRSRLALATDVNSKNPMGMIEMILNADAKNVRNLNEEEYAKKLKFSDNAFSPLML
jgi:hypothetical protein